MSSVSANLTVCILAKNEESRIGVAVKSVAEVGAKILIIDSFSTDKTFEVAEDAWIKAGRSLEDFIYLAKEWMGFVRSREDSTKHVTTRWVMWLDADEWIECDLAKWLKEHVEYLNLDNVYAFRRRSIFLGRVLKHGGWYPDYKTRLCRVGHAIWKNGPRGAHVHEDLVPVHPDGKRVFVDVHIGHLPFQDEQEQRETNENYSTLLAEGLAQEWLNLGRKPYGVLYEYLKVFIKFVENYVWKRGFLDGPQGRKIAVGSAWSLKRRIEKARDLYWSKRP